LEVAGGDHTIADGFGHRRLRAGVPPVLRGHILEQRRRTTAIALILRNLHRCGRWRVAEHRCRCDMIAQVQVDVPGQRPDIERVRLHLDCPFDELRGIRKLAAVFPSRGRELPEGARQPGVDLEGLAHQAVVPDDVAARHHEEERLEQVQLRRERIDPARAADRLDRLACAARPEQETGIVHVSGAVVRRQVQPVAVELFGLDRIATEPRLLYPCFAEGRTEFQRAIEGLRGSRPYVGRRRVPRITHQPQRGGHFTFQ